MLLSAKEVAARLGVCERTAIRLMQSGAIRGFQVGGKLWRTRPEIVDAYIREGLTIRSAPETTSTGRV